MNKKKQPTVTDVLKRMKTLLTKKGWVQGYFAKTRTGKICEAHSRAAVGYCLVGARLKASEDLGASYDDQGADVDYLLRKCFPRRQSITSFNDAKGRKKSEVLAVVDCAIKKSLATKESE